MSSETAKKPTAWDKKSVDSRLGPNVHGGTHDDHTNVLDTPLLQHSTRSSLPMASRALPSDFKAGFCDEQSPVAAQLTQSFLDFTSKNGVNLKQMGVRPGQKWCLSAEHWKQVVDRGDADGVPPINLESTHKEALKTLDLDVLKKYSSQLESARYKYDWDKK